MKSGVYCIIVTALCLSFAGNAQNGFTAEGGVPVAYSRMIFGQFIEHFHRQIYGGIFEPGSPLADGDGFRADVAEALKELKIPIIRWPGGCFASSYHWLDGVGPSRQPAWDKAWWTEEPNAFGTVEFVKWCRRIGAEPYICTNAGTGTPEEMSDWVEYCNLDAGKFAALRKAHGCEEPLNVKYWSIGNEPYLTGEIGAKAPAEWAPAAREAAKMMRAADGNIILLAAATLNGDWALPLLQHAGAWLNYVCIHGYYGWQSAPYMDIILQTERPGKEIAAMTALLDKAGVRGKVKIAFDEWNARGWYSPGGNQPGSFGMNRDSIPVEREKNEINATYTMADAVFAACFLNACLRRCEDVPVAGFSPAVNTTGALYVHPKGIVKRTTFHVLSMYANQLERNVVPVKVNSESLTHGNYAVPVLDAVLTCNDDKTAFVAAAVNKHPEKSIDFAPDFSLLKTAPKQVQATALSGSSPDDFNDVGAENRVAPVEKTMKVTDGKVSIPPHSVVLIKYGKHK